MTKREIGMVQIELLEYISESLLRIEDRLGPEEPPSEEPKRELKPLGKMWERGGPLGGMDARRVTFWKYNETGDVYFSVDATLCGRVDRLPPIVVYWGVTHPNPALEPYVRTKEDFGNRFTCVEAPDAE